MTQPEIQMLPVERLMPCEVNPRFQIGDVSELADSIAALGVLVPLLATPRGTGYLIVAGHRRLAAAKTLGLHELPVILRDLSELERLKMMLVENQQRVPLSPVEEGIAYARILKQHAITQRELAKQVGKSEWYVSTRLNILKLPRHVVDQIHAGELTVSTALGYQEPSAKRVRRHGVHIPGIRPTPCKLANHVGHSDERCEIRPLAEAKA